MSLFVLQSPNTPFFWEKTSNCAFYIRTLGITAPGFGNIRVQASSENVEFKVFEADLSFGAKVEVMGFILSDRSVTISTMVDQGGCQRG